MKTQTNVDCYLKKKTQNSVLLENLKKLTEIKIVPFERSVVGGDPVITDTPVVAYGSTAIDTVVARNDWKPALWRVDGVIESNSRDALGDLYLNDDLVVCSVHDGAKIASERGWDQFFIKPNTDSKEFAGTITDTGRYGYLLESVFNEDWIDDDFDVVVSSIKPLGLEWRLVVVDGKVADYSIYRKSMRVDPERSIRQEVLDLADQAIKRHNPAPVFVIDIGEYNGMLKVIEYNGFNSSGLYHCDINNIVDAVNDYVVREYG